MRSMAPSWRILLWSIVVFRLLLVTIPAAPWSAFNLVRWQNDTKLPERVANDVGAQEMFVSAEERAPAARQIVAPTGPDNDASPTAALVEEIPKMRADSAANMHAVARRPWQFSIGAARYSSLARLLSPIWLAGCLVFALQLGVTSVALRRRLAACRAVRDPAFLKLLETACQRMGRKRIPRLVVTPDLISPC